MTRQQQVAAVLVRLDGWIPANHSKSKAEVADEHAKFIDWAIRGIKGKSRGGPARALRDLSAAARKAIAKKDAAGWARAWAECPRRTRWLILRNTLSIVAGRTIRRIQIPRRHCARLLSP
jgi:hypothetical protein